MIPAALSTTTFLLKHLIINIVKASTVETNKFAFICRAGLIDKLIFFNSFS